MKPFSLEEYLKNPSRKVVTRDGRDVRIICTDFDNSDFPIIGGIKGSMWPDCFTANGFMIKGDEHPADLFFAPEKHEGWVNIYKNQMTGSMYCDCNIYTSNEDAKKQHGIAIAKIEWEE